MKTEVYDYFQSFPLDQRKRLIELRKLVFEVAPTVEEKMAYQMPCYMYKGKPLVYFASFSKHIGIYGLPIVNEDFRNQLEGFKKGKGSIQFPNNLCIPIDLLQRLLMFRKSEIDKQMS